MSVYRIECLEGVVSQDIPELPTTMPAGIPRSINARLGVDPIAYGKPLRYRLKGRWRLRVGDWRVVYLVDQSRRIVTITANRHRRNVYEDR